MNALARNTIADCDALTVREAAAMADLSTSRIRDLAACGTLTSERRGRQYLIDREPFFDFLRRRAARRPRPKLRLVIDNT